MNRDSQSREATGARRARWIAFGFVGAFAASVATVIYTGLMVEGSRSTFDAGFRSVTLALGETRTLVLEFEVETGFTGASLEVELPAMIEAVGQPGARRITREVTVGNGANEYPLEVRAVAAGSDYVIGRIVAGEPVALERLFVTVVAE